MGHAISRTKPSIVASDRFARAPSIDVFWKGSAVVTMVATQQAVKTQKRSVLFIPLPRRRWSPSNCDSPSGIAACETVDPHSDHAGAVIMVGRDRPDVDPR